MSEQPRITVRTYGATVPYSIEAALDAGAITEDQARALGWTPPPPPSWLKRLHRAWREWWWSHRPTVHLGPCDHENCA